MYPTYKGLIMAGYQGWFRAEGDEANRGWGHFGRGNKFNPASENRFADFKNIMTKLNIPYYYVPGNHDIGMVPNDATLAFYRSTMDEDYYT